MNAAAVQLLAAWDRLGPMPPTHWDARNAALLDAFGLTGVPDTAGARQAALLEVYAANFGERLDGMAACAGCGTEVELDVPVRELVSGVPAADPVEPFDVDGVTVHWRLPGAADLAASARCADAAEGAAVLLATIAGGASVSEAARVVLAQRVAAADPFADISFELTCPQCATVWQSQLDIGEFVLARLRFTARRLLGEVDELARAYGWSESQILTLSPQRRWSYLELVRHG
jgi:hypothetical protein